MALSDQAFLQKLRETFQIEAAEYVQGIGEQLLRLEQRPLASLVPGDFEGLFRTAHSLKGAARAVSALEVEAVCHEIESVVQRWKRAEATPVPEAFDAIHSAMEVIARLLARGSKPAPADEPAAVAGAIAGLKQHRAGTAEPTAAPRPVPRAPVPPPVVAPAVAEQPGRDAVAESPSPVGVRIPLGKLEQVWQQSEELVGTKQVLRRHRRGWQELQDSLRQWDGRWILLQRARRELESALRRPEGANAVAAGRLPAECKDVLDFLDWTEAHLRGIQRLVGAAEERARRDELGVGRITDAVLEQAKSLLMLPAGSVLEGLPLLVRQLARATGKQVAVDIRGAGVEIDNRVLGEIKDALIHLVRNAVDHGIELPAARSAGGKPAGATLVVQVRAVDGAKVEISVTDDGCGIDPQAVRRIAVEKGLLKAADAAALDDAGATQLIFESGFSTRAGVTDLSGRGLGLAIVAEKAQRLGGRVTVDSVPGRRTRFVLLIPIALAAFRGLVVAVRDRRFILDSTAVERVARVARAEIRFSENRRSVRLGGRWVGLCEMAGVLELPAAAAEEPPPLLHLVLLGAGDARVAFVVDGVLHEEEVLVRKLAPPLDRLPNVAGATLLASGELVPVLNPTDLLRRAQDPARRPAMAAAPAVVPAAPRARRRILVADDSITSRTLIRGILETAGYDVVTAAHGMEALEYLRRDRFDLLVSDVEMPRLNGIDLTARVRADRRLADLPVVLVTALASDEDRARGMDAGASAYIGKNDFERSNLLEVISLLL